MTDLQWQAIRYQIPGERWGGRTRSVDMREVVNGILYLNRTGCQWRAIPHDLPNKSTVRHYYDRFRREGVWTRIHQTLYMQCRLRAGRHDTPSTVVIDAQSVKTTEKGGYMGTMLARR